MPDPRPGPARQTPDQDPLAGAWQDVSRSVGDWVQSLLRAMTLEEKASQLGSVWKQQNTGGGDVAPMEGAIAGPRQGFAEAIEGGLGHLTRIFGSAPLTAAQGVADLIQSSARWSRPTGSASRPSRTGSARPGSPRSAPPSTPPHWPGAIFDPGLIARMARVIGSDMAAVGVHQGLSPVLDVVRDARWGRTEETMGEDPYLVSVLGTAYVQGLQDGGLIATPKHFAGYAASRGARNHAPVSIGPRELADVVLPPFEMAVRVGGAGSVMNSYADLDGVPPVADRRLMSELLRDEWGFADTVVSDYWSVMFLEQMHHVSTSSEQSAVLALRAGMDVELPETGRTLCCRGRCAPGCCRSGCWRRRRAGC